MAKGSGLASWVKLSVAGKDTSKEDGAVVGRTPPPSLPPSLPPPHQKRRLTGVTKAV